MSCRKLFPNIQNIADILLLLQVNVQLIAGRPGTVIDTKLILQYALKAIAHGIILAHNHPRGNLNPSEADLRITERIKNACETVEISLIDHLVISSTEEYQSIL